MGTYAVGVRHEAVVVHSPMRSRPASPRVSFLRSDGARPRRRRWPFADAGVGSQVPCIPGHLGSDLLGVALAGYHEARRPDNLSRFGRQHVAETPRVLAETPAGQSDTPSAASQRTHHRLTTREGSPSDGHYRRAEPWRGSGMDIVPRITNPGAVTSSTDSPPSSIDNRQGLG
jgi:hypothetical protein